MGGAGSDAAPSQQGLRAWRLCLESLSCRPLLKPTHLKPTHLPPLQPGKGLSQIMYGDTRGSSQMHTLKLVVGGAKVSLSQLLWEWIFDVPEGGDWRRHNYSAYAVGGWG